MGKFIALALVVAVIVAVAAPPDMLFAHMPAGEFVARAAFGLIAVSLAASLVHRYRGRLGTAARDMLIWVALGLGFVALYAYRDTFRPAYEQLMAELSPGSVISPAPGVAEVAQRGDGHFVLSMRANGVDLPFLFDTGASSVVIRAEDASRIGIDPASLQFSQTVSTANGVTRGADVLLDSLAVGSIVQRRVRAMVAAQGALDENLLGQSFLVGLQAYGVENGRLVLRGK